MEFSEQSAFFAHHPSPKRQARAVNVSLDFNIVAEAKTLGINVSKACEAGLMEHVRQARIARWQEENREGIEESNAYVEKYGLPLAKYRQF